MRISDWSSDVCSSDLWATPPAHRHPPDRSSRDRQSRTPRPPAPHVAPRRCPKPPLRRPPPATPARSPAPTAPARAPHSVYRRSEEHTSELQSLMRISYAVFCLKKKKQLQTTTQSNKSTYTIHI